MDFCIDPIHVLSWIKNHSDTYLSYQELLPSSFHSSPWFDSPVSAKEGTHISALHAHTPTKKTSWEVGNIMENVNSLPTMSEVSISCARWMDGQLNIICLSKSEKIAENRTIRFFSLHHCLHLVKYYWMYSQTKKKKKKACNPSSAFPSKNYEGHHTAKIFVHVIISYPDLEVITSINKCTEWTSVFTNQFETGMQFHWLAPHSIDSYMSCCWCCCLSISKDCQLLFVGCWTYR